MSKPRTQRAAGCLLWRPRSLAADLWKSLSATRIADALLRTSEKTQRHRRGAADGTAIAPFESV